MEVARRREVAVFVQAFCPGGSRLVNDFAESLAKPRLGPNLRVAYMFKNPAVEIVMLKQTCSALALSLLFVLPPAAAMAYGGYIPPAEEVKPAPPHHMMKHHRQKEMKHHRAVGETPKMEEKTH